MTGLPDYKSVGGRRNYSRVTDEAYIPRLRTVVWSGCLQEGMICDTIREVSALYINGKMNGPRLDVEARSCQEA